MEKGSTIISSYSKNNWIPDSYPLEPIRLQEKDLFSEVVNLEVKKVHDKIKLLQDKKPTGNLAISYSDEVGTVELDLLSLKRDKKLNQRFSFNYSRASQKWMGHITSIGNSSFIARLKDLTNGGTDEEVELEISEVSPGDQSLISLGSVFYWSIGKEMVNGQIKTESLIRFKRSPLQVEEFDKAMDIADDLFDGLEWD